MPSSPKSSKHFYPFSLCRYPHSHTQFHAPCALWGSAIVWSTRAKCLLDKQNRRKDLMRRDLSKIFSRFSPHPNGTVACPVGFTIPERWAALPRSPSSPKRGSCLQVDGFLTGGRGWSSDHSFWRARPNFWQEITRR